MFLLFYLPIGQRFSKDVSKLPVGFPRNFGCHITADKDKFINKFV
jgi:hypothetical protein